MRWTWLILLCLLVAACRTRLPVPGMRIEGNTMVDSDDLVEAAETDSDGPIGSLRVDGGMTANPTFVQAVADATGRPVEVSPAWEATTLGAAFLAGLHTGAWGGWDDIAATWSPDAVVEPGAPLDRERWRRAVERAAAWEEGLSGIDFAD